MTQSTEQLNAPPGFFEHLAKMDFSPGWAKKKPQMWPRPQPEYVPAVWRYADARAALDQATAFVSPEFAERRNLIMVNPVAGNIYPTCRNLVAAYQLVMPGETARSHRHTPNALRLILDSGESTYTIVNGVKVDVLPGDVVLTPSWHWHGHSNTGSEPAFWIDFLDVPLVQNLENMFFEDHPDRNERPVAHDPDSVLRYRGTTLDERVREAGSIEVAPGGLGTITLKTSGWTEGQEQLHRPAMESAIFAVTQGEVSFRVKGLDEVTLTRGDVIVIPCWHEYSIRGKAHWSQILKVSDEPVTRMLGFLDVQVSC